MSDDIVSKAATTRGNPKLYARAAPAVHSAVDLAVHQGIVDSRSALIVEAVAEWLESRGIDLSLFEEAPTKPKGDRWTWDAFGDLIGTGVCGDYRVEAYGEGRVCVDGYPTVEAVAAWLRRHGWDVERDDEEGVS